MKPFRIPREDFEKWRRANHTASELPGCFKDREGVYDISVVGEEVTIYPRARSGRANPGGRS